MSLPSCRTGQSTDRHRLNPEPVMITELRPAAGPEEGVSEVITGAIVLPSIGDQ